MPWQNWTVQYRIGSIKYQITVFQPFSQQSSQLHSGEKYDANLQTKWCTSRSHFGALNASCGISVKNKHLIQNVLRLNNKTFSCQEGPRFLHWTSRIFPTVLFQIHEHCIFASRETVPLNLLMAIILLFACCSSLQHP